MANIIETRVEPSVIYTGSIFKLKVKVEDYYFYKRKLATETGMIIITENNDEIKTEWGE